MSAQPTLFDEPRARHRDPDTSHRARASVAPAIPALRQAVLNACTRFSPSSAFDIARRVEVAAPGRWDEGTIRGEVSRLGRTPALVKDGKGKSPRGQSCDLWRMP